MAAMMSYVLGNLMTAGGVIGAVFLDGGAKAIAIGVAMIGLGALAGGMVGLGAGRDRIRLGARPRGPYA